MAEIKCPGFDRSRISRLQRFHDLMRFRVNDILLVSSLYDSFILSEDGQVSELILSEFLDLNLHHTPGLTRVSTGQEALDRLRDQQHFNLVVTSLHVGDMDALATTMTLRQRLWKAFDRVLAHLPGPPEAGNVQRATPDPHEPGISDEERLARHRLFRARYSRTGKGGR